MSAADNGNGNSRRTHATAFQTPAAGRRSQRRRIITDPLQPRVPSHHTPASGCHASRQSSRRPSRRRNAVTPGSASSIRDGARDRTRGSGICSNRSYSAGYRHSQEPGILFSPQAPQPRDPPPAAPAEWFCYCDKPADSTCDQCSGHRFCVNHPGFYCSGPCGQWIHAKCAGYDFHLGPDGGEEGAFLRARFGYPNPMVVPISDSSQGNYPLYCSIYLFVCFRYE